MRILHSLKVNIKKRLSGSLNIYLLYKAQTHSNSGGDLVAHHEYDGFFESFLKLISAIRMDIKLDELSVIFLKFALEHRTDE